VKLHGLLVVSWSSEIQRMVFHRRWKLNCGNCRPGGHVTGVYNSCVGEWLLIGRLEVNWTVNRQRTLSREGRAARAVESCFALLSW